MVFRLCEAGKMTRREIARQLEVSSTRVGQIYAAARTKLQDFAEHGEDALTLLPARVRQVVVDCGRACMAGLFKHEAAKDEIQNSVP